MPKCPRTGKIRYPTAAAAGKALEQTHAKGHRTSAYVCPHCRAWHLTSKGMRGQSPPDVLY